MEEKQLTGYPSIDKPWLKYYTEEAINAKLPECTIYEYLWENNKDHLDDVALIYFNRKITYKELFENIEKTAKAFVGLGVKKGDIVAIALPNIPENIYCMYALNKIGAIADMIDLRSKGEVLIHYFNETSAKITVICDLFANNTFDVVDKTKIEKIIVASPYDSLIVPMRFLMRMKSKEYNNAKTCCFLWRNFVKQEDLSKLNNEGLSSDVACIFHTSGTTGLSKGVMLTNLAFNSMVLNISCSGLRCVPQEIMLNQVPPFLAYNALCTTHLSLTQHFRMILLPEYKPDKFVSNIIKLKPNYVVAGPADYSNFLEVGKIKKDLSFLKSMISGSDSLLPKNKVKINNILQTNGCKEKILEGYGMTEIGAGACTNIPNHDIEGSVGIPLPLNTFCIFNNETEKELSYNEHGEICMTGPTIMKGYYNKPNETNAVLKFHNDGKLWLHSGDLGYINEDGNVFLDGRLKRIIVRFDGIKISPFEVEKTISMHTNVSACCCVGKFDEEHQRGQNPIVFFTLDGQIKVNINDTIEQLKKMVQDQLDEKYWPKEYVLLQCLPLTPNGKVDYRALEKEAEKL